MLEIIMSIYIDFNELMRSEMTKISKQLVETVFWNASNNILCKNSL